MRHHVVRSRWTLTGLAVVVALALAALAAPLIAPGDPYHGRLAAALQAPSRAFPLGTDAQGRDILSRLLFGARLSLAVGLASQLIALAVGLTLGLAAGFYGRSVDAVVMRAADVTLAFPSLLLLIAVAAAVKPTLPVVCVVIGVVGWAGMARLVRGQVLVVRRLDYVHAARVRRLRRTARHAPRAPQRPRAGDRRRHARCRRRHHGRSRALVRGTGGAAAHALLGRDGGRGPRPAAGGAVGVAVPRPRDRPDGGSRQRRRGRVTRRARCPRRGDMTLKPGLRAPARRGVRPRRAHHEPSVPSQGTGVR